MDNLRRFLITITLTIFGVVAAFGFLLMLKYDDAFESRKHELDSKSTSNPTELTNVDEENIFYDNVLFILSDDETNEPDVFSIVNYNSATAALSFLYIPKDLKIISPETNEVYTLSEYFKDNGTDKTKLLLSTFLNIGIPYYIDINYDSFVSFINMFGTVSFNMPVEITKEQMPSDLYTGVNGDSLSAGLQNFDGSMALRLFRFYKSTDDVYNTSLAVFYDGRDIKRIEMVHSFITSFISQKLSNNYADKFEKYFGLLIESCETNLNKDLINNLCINLENVKAETVQYFMVYGNETVYENYYIEYTDIVLNMLTKESLPASGVYNPYFISTE